MSRRTERPYKVDGTGQLARHSAARCSVPEINGPVVQQEFTFLLRETCSPAPPLTAGAAVSNGRRGTAGVSRGRSTESNEPDNEETGRTHNSGRAELGRQSRPSMALTWSVEADWLSYQAATIMAEKECCVIPQGLPGNRRTRTRMYGGVGGGGSNPWSNPPADPISRTMNHNGPQLSPEHSRRHHHRKAKNTGNQAPAKTTARHQSEFHAQKTATTGKSSQATYAPHRRTRYAEVTGNRTTERHSSAQNVRTVDS